MTKQEDFPQHISASFDSELEALKKLMLEMGGKVEAQLSAALSAVVEVDTEAAEAVVESDVEVNQMEMEIDEECATLIARRQPTASDLRLVVAIIKVNTDLERIGDEAAKVAKQALYIAKHKSSPSKLVELKRIGKRVSFMLHDALDAFVRLDVNKAIEVVKGDDEVDEEYGSAMRSLMTFMMEDPRELTPVLNEMWALRSLERIGDHACNIAEHVIYLVRGLDVRHGRLDEMGWDVLDRN